MKMKLFTVHNFGYDLAERSLCYRTNEDGSLFGLSAKGFRKTALMESRFKDNPDYVYGRFYKRWGYLNVKDIKAVKYEPIPALENHVFRDDCLRVSYVDTEDIRVYGNEILTVLVALRDRFGWDIDPVKEEMWQKCLSLKQVNSFNYDSFFDEAVKSREHFDAWFRGSPEKERESL